MAELLTGKTAVVTGASSGNGRAISLRFADHGADVVVADIKPDPRGSGVPTHEKIESETDANATFVECDATSREDLIQAIGSAEAFGGLDVMVNNVGGSERGTDFLDAADDVYDRYVDLNLRSTYLGSQLACAKFVDRGEGCIINMSSVDGLKGDPDAPIYSAAKGGVRLLTYSLAARFGEHGIRVNAIHPGLIRTFPTLDEDGELLQGLDDMFIPHTPLGRAGEPDEVGKAAVFLASDLASYVTGESLVVDGGFSSSN